VIGELIGSAGVLDLVDGVAAHGGLFARPDLAHPLQHAELDATLFESSVLC
jgi:hypothetical protein